MRSRTKGPNRFSRFDVYWIQTNRHPDKLNLSMDEGILKGLKGLGGDTPGACMLFSGLECGEMGGG